MSERRYYKADLSPDYDGAERIECSKEEANVVSSLTQGFDNTHMPVLDIDYSAELIPSTTPGHFHLYLNREISWEQYRRLLLSMADCGLLEEGFMDASLGRGKSFVRLPHVKKETRVVGDQLTFPHNSVEAELVQVAAVAVCWLEARGLRMNQALEAIREERHQQDLKFGPQRQQSSGKWNAIMGEEVGEVATALLDGGEL